MRLVLNATNTLQKGLIEVVVVCARVAVVHAPAVSVVAIALRATPPVAVVADIDEIAIGKAAAARKGGLKSSRVG